MVVPFRPFNFHSKLMVALVVSSPFVRKATRFTFTDSFAEDDTPFIVIVAQNALRQSIYANYQNYRWYSDNTVTVTYC
jgi:hypothetical protein